jgi:hypothetical protein
VQFHVFLFHSFVRNANDFEIILPIKLLDVEHMLTDRHARSRPVDPILDSGFLQAGVLKSLHKYTEIKRSDDDVIFPVSNHSFLIEFRDNLQKALYSRYLLQGKGSNLKCVFARSTVKAAIA